MLALVIVSEVERGRGIPSSFLWVEPQLTIAPCTYVLMAVRTLPLIEIWSEDIHGGRSTFEMHVCVYQLTRAKDGWSINQQYSCVQNMHA